MTTAKGGRPRALSLEEIRQQQPLEARNNEKEVRDSLATNSLAELKRLWCSHIGRMALKTLRRQGDFTRNPPCRRGDKGN